MSYLFPLGDAAGLGVLQVGSNITVDANSVISIPQSVANTANITFANITDSALTSGRITFAGTSGLLSDSGNLTFSIDTLTLPKANITTTATIANANVTGTLNVTGLTTLANANITTTATIANANVTGTFNVTGLTTLENVSITNANVSGNLKLNGYSVITNISPTAGNGISLSNVVSNGPNASFTVTNTGVLNLTAGTGINVSASTGNVTISATGSSIINTTGPVANYTITATDEYVGVGGVTPTTVTLPAGVTGTLYYIKNEKTNASKVTVACTGVDTIDGAASKELSQNASITVVYHTLAWRIV